MSALAPALLESLRRLLPIPPLEAPVQLALQQVVNALCVALERGELALDLEGPPPQGLAAETAASQTASEATPSWPEAHLAALRACAWLVDATALDESPEAPVVHDGRWLRWRRWHQQLQHCTCALIDRGQAMLDPPPAAGELGRARAMAAAAGLDPQQCGAVDALLRHRLVLLNGGPGTGKTSTVVQMLAAALRLQPELRLQLAAPTGKAAARLSSAVASGAQGLEPELAQRLQSTGCGTLHRLLEARGDGAGFRRGAGRPLDLDLLVIDEVSMVDLPLMQALLAALPPAARLLLVGDPHQLAPVGPGAVLLELCRPGSRTALGPAAVELRTTYRNDGAIADLAGWLREKPLQGPELLASLRTRLQQLQPSANVQWRDVPGARPPTDALTQLRQHQQRLETLAQPLKATPQTASCGAGQALLAELERLILLSPIRQGPWGVDGVHRALLGEALSGPLHRWPLGTPVLNRRNMAEQGLANGDIGVLVAGSDGGRLVLFPGGRLLHPARLGAAEPALALTVHKAQGSQYGEVLLLLPPSRQLTARLIYTGLTRARLSAQLYTNATGP